MPRRLRDDAAHGRRQLLGNNVAIGYADAVNVANVVVVVWRVAHIFADAHADCHRLRDAEPDGLGRAHAVTHPVRVHHAVCDADAFQCNIF